LDQEFEGLLAIAPRLPGAGNAAEKGKNKNTVQTLS